MIPLRKAALGLALVGTTLAGGAVGAALITGTAGAQTSTTTTPTTAVAPAPGVDSSNSDATHEAAETPAREAEETAGHMGGGHGGHSNTDAAHEAAESPERAAEEAARDAATPATPAPSTTTTAN